MIEMKRASAAGEQKAAGQLRRDRRPWRIPELEAHGEVADRTGGQGTFSSHVGMS